MVKYVKRHATELDGILFYKVDRAARNLFDYVELERLESEYGIPFISVSQPTESTPAGRMQRRMLATMGAFFTEQQALDIREGLSRRVQNGLFPGRVPFGYRTIRVEGRSLPEVDPLNGPKVTRLFHFYAYECLTLDTLSDKLVEEGISYRDSTPRFPRNSRHNILRDRSYIGEVQYKGQWFPGKHAPLVDRTTWDRVQVLLGEKV